MITQWVKVSSIILFLALLRILFIVLKELSTEEVVTGITRRISQSAFNSQYPMSASNIFVNGLSSALYLSQLTIDFMKNVKDFKSASTASALRMGKLLQNVMTYLSCKPDNDWKVSNQLANNIISIDLSLNWSSISLMTQYLVIPATILFTLSSSIRQASNFISVILHLIFFCKSLSLTSHCFEVSLKCNFVIVINVMTLVKLKSFFVKHCWARRVH